MDSPAKTNKQGYPVVRQPPPYQMAGAAPGHDGEAPVFAVKRDLREAEGKRETEESVVNVNCDRIAFLYAKKRIEWRQFMAAERLWKDYYDMGQFPKASNVIVGNGASGGAMGPGDVQVNASRRFYDAKRVLEQARNWAMVQLVVIGPDEESGPVSIEKAAALLHYNSQYAKGCLDCALHMLANHYRFA